MLLDNNTITTTKLTIIEGACHQFKEGMLDSVNGEPPATFPDFCLQEAYSKGYAFGTEIAQAIPAAE